MWDDIDRSLRDTFIRLGKTFSVLDSFVFVDIADNLDLLREGPVVRPRCGIGRGYP